MASTFRPPPPAENEQARNIRLAQNWQSVDRPRSRFLNKNLLQAIQALPAELGANGIIPYLDLHSRRSLAESCSLGHKFVHTLSAVFTPVYRANQSLEGWYWASEILKVAADDEQRYRRVKCSLDSDDVNLAIAIWDGARIPHSPRTTVTAIAAISALHNLAQLEIFKCETLSTNVLLDLIGDLKQLKRVLVDDCLFVSPTTLIKEWSSRYRHITLDIALPTLPAKGTFTPINVNAHFHWLAFVLWAIPFLTKTMPYMLAPDAVFFQSVVKQLNTFDIAPKLQKLIQICIKEGAVTEIEDMYGSDSEYELEDYEIDKVVETQLKTIAQTPYFKQALLVFLAVNGAHPQLNVACMKASRDPAGTRLFLCSEHGPTFGGLMTKEQRKVGGDDVRECFAEVMDMAQDEAQETDWFDYMPDTNTLLQRLVAANRVCDDEGNCTFPGRRFSDANHAHSCAGFPAGMLDAGGRVVPASIQRETTSTAAASPQPTIPVLVSGDVPAKTPDVPKPMPAPHHKLAKTSQQVAEKMIPQEHAQSIVAETTTKEISPAPVKKILGPHHKMAMMQQRAPVPVIEAPRPTTMFEYSTMLSDSMLRIRTTHKAEARQTRLDERAAAYIAVQEARLAYQESVATVQDELCNLQEILTAPLESFCCRLGRKLGGAEHDETCDRLM